MLYGGPTSSRFQSWRVAAFDVSSELAPAPGRTLRLTVRTPGLEPRPLSLTTDDEGLGWLNFVYPKAPKAPLDVMVQDAERGSVAIGSLRLYANAWEAGATRPPVWSEAKGSGALGLRFAAARGRFAVPFSDRLLFETYDARGPLGGVTLRLAGAGVALGETNVTSDDAGRAFVALRPLEHAATVRVRARAADGRELEASAVLPVLPGALHAELRGERLVVTSPVERRHAFVALVGRDARYWGGRVVLDAAANGTAQGSVALPPLPSAGPLWAVVSSAPGLDSPASCGWPLRGANAQSPLQSFDRGEVVLFDGVAQARARYLVWSARVRVLLGVVLGSAAVLAAGVLLLRTLEARRRLARHLERQLERGEASRGAVLGGIAGLLLGVCAVAMGFALLALFALYRAG